MRLLVSVMNEAEAAAALDGGAEVVDAKDPSVEALGAVSPRTFRRIVASVAGARPVSAALGEPLEAPAAEAAARRFVAAGASFVKVGFRDGLDATSVQSVIRAAARGAQAAPTAVSAGAVAVWYADRPGGLPPDPFLETAARAGAIGVLLDTADKQGARLTSIIDGRGLATWVSTAHRWGLFAALAGQLTLADLPLVRDAGADIAGVRGAACRGGRSGPVEADLVGALVAASGGLVDRTRWMCSGFRGAAPPRPGAKREFTGRK